MGWLGRLFCRHEWDVRVRVVTRPVKSVAHARIPAGSEEWFERLMHGSVRAVCTCQKCGALDVRIVTGMPDQEEAHS